MNKAANKNRGYTLIELMVSMGLFAIVLTLTSGAYFIMIDVSRKAQATSTGIDNLSFALETMARTIRTSTNYACNGSGDCASGGARLDVRDSDGNTVRYRLSNGVITQDGIPLTDPSVSVSGLTFYVTGTRTTPADYTQARATFVVSGSVVTGPGTTETFMVQSGATMRGTDL